MKKTLLNLLILVLLFSFCKATKQIPNDLQSEVNLTKLLMEEEIGILIESDSVYVSAWEFDHESSADRATLKAHLKQIPKWHELVNIAIEDDIIEGGEVIAYLDHFLSNMDASELSKIGVDSTLAYTERFPAIYENFKLHSIWFYNDEGVVSTHFDHYLMSDGLKLTNYILVVELDSNGKIQRITTES